MIQSSVYFLHTISFFFPSNSFSLSFKLIKIKQLRRRGKNCIHPVSRVADQTKRIIFKLYFLIAHFSSSFKLKTLFFCRVRRSEREKSTSEKRWNFNFQVHKNCQHKIHKILDERRTKPLESDSTQPCQRLCEERGEKYELR